MATLAGRGLPSSVQGPVPLPWTSATRPEGPMIWPSDVLIGFSGCGGGYGQPESRPDMLVFNLKVLDMQGLSCLPDPPSVPDLAALKSFHAL